MRRKTWRIRFKSKRKSGYIKRLQRSEDGGHGKVRKDAFQ